MKTKLTLLTLLVAPWLPAQQPAVPRVTYLAGVVKDSAGQPHTGTLSIAFSLYEEQQGGAALWTETQSVSVDEHGGYAVLLGAMQQGGLPVDLFSSGKARWLGIVPQFPGAQEQPRVALAGVPYALKAVDADTLGGLPASAFLHVDTLTPVAAGHPAGSPVLAPMAVQSGVQPAACTALTGGGIANQVTKFITPCRIGDSALFESGGLVGIGTTAPAATLEVIGTAKADPPSVTTGAGPTAFTGIGADTYDATANILPGAGIAATGGSNRSTNSFPSEGYGVLATGGAVVGSNGAAGTGVRAQAGSGGSGGAGGFGVEGYGSDAGSGAGAGPNPGGSGVYGQGGGSFGPEELAGDGVLGIGGNGSADTNSYGGGNGLEGIGGYGGSGGRTGGFGVRAEGGFDINGNPAPAAFFEGQMWVFSSGGTGAPQALLQQSVASDYSRLRFTVNAASSYWDIAVGGGTKPVMNFFRSGTGNVMSLTPGASNLLVMSNGAKLTSGGTWTNSSDRNAKMDFREVDGQEVLQRLNSIPITTWSYRAEGADVRHIGPMAQDFRAAFGLGEDEKHITTIDADGVALAALQQLYRENLAKDLRIHELESRLESLEKRFEEVEKGAH